MSLFRIIIARRGRNLSVNIAVFTIWSLNLIKNTLTPCAPPLPSTNAIRLPRTPTELTLVRLNGLHIDPFHTHQNTPAFLSTSVLIESKLHRSLSSESIRGEVKKNL